MSTLGQVILEGTDASKPAASIPGRLFFTTDTSLIYYDNGTAWVTVGPSGSGFGNPMTAEADLIVGGTSGAPTRLGTGSAGQVLTSQGPGVQLDWATPSTSSNATEIQSVPVSATAPTTGQVLEYNGTDWIPATPSGSTNATEIQGVAVSATAPTSGQVLEYNSGASAWQPTSPVNPYDVASYMPGTFVGGQVCFELNVVRAFSLPANCTGSLSRLDTAATASTVFTISQNGTSVGSITFSSGGTTGTFSTTAAVSLSIGDFLEITAPGTADATAAGLSLTLLGTRS
jgi:hypothetical protein